MANSTTLAVWRSNGGDNTRTTIAGSMEMAAPFYIANAAASGSLVSSSNAVMATAVILPANAVVTDITISSTGTGNMDFGFTPLTNIGPGKTPVAGTAVPTGYLANVSAATKGSFNMNSTTAGAYMGQVANATAVVAVTSEANASASGSVSGYIKYFVLDSGVQAV